MAEATESQPNADTNGMPVPPPSKRQKKRQKKAQHVVRNKDADIEKTVTYLTKWDANRDEWKYEKLRQIFIQKNIFDENIIANEHSEVAIKYLATSKVMLLMRMFFFLLVFHNQSISMHHFTVGSGT